MEIISFHSGRHWCHMKNLGMKMNIENGNYHGAIDCDKANLHKPLTSFTACKAHRETLVLFKIINFSKSFAENSNFIYSKRTFVCITPFSSKLFIYH